MKETNSLKERNKAVADVFSVERPVQLTAYDFDYYFEEKREQMRETLMHLSGLQVKVKRGFLLRKEFHAYFTSVASAQSAAWAIKRIAYCQTKICTGTFDVTNLERNNHM